MKSLLRSLVLLGLLLPGLVNAELLQYRYTDTQGQEKIQPSSQIYGNPDGGNVEIALSGGLDRKVRVEVWKGGWLVTSAASSVLNQISINTTFDVGRYQIRARLLNKNTGTEGFSETIDIHVYDVPKLAVVGTRTAFTGAPIQLTAQLWVQDQPIVGVVEWWLAKEKQKVAEGI